MSKNKLKGRIAGGNGDRYHVVELDEDRWSVLFVVWGDERDVRVGYATSLQQGQAMAEAHYYQRRHSLQ
jgi:hypothetical protein